eukprot:4669-Heterococcus_DN1.PRE.1
MQAALLRLLAIECVHKWASVVLAYSCGDVHEQGANGDASKHKLQLLLHGSHVHKAWPDLVNNVMYQFAKILSCVIALLFALCCSSRHARASKVHAKNVMFRRIDY